MFGEVRLASLERVAMLAGPLLGALDFARRGSLFRPLAVLVSKLVELACFKRAAGGAGAFFCALGGACGGSFHRPLAVRMHVRLLAAAQRQNETDDQKRTREYGKQPFCHTHCQVSPLTVRIFGRHPPSTFIIHHSSTCVKFMMIEKEVVFRSSFFFREEKRRAEQKKKEA